MEKKTCFSLFLSIPSIRNKDRTIEKLRTKAVREEYHGDGDGIGYKRLYKWGTINANIWLPSLSELVGYNPGTYHDGRGCYDAAMLGINLSNTTEGKQVDIQGGNQFAYFQQFNASGGGTRIWNACNQQISWLRTSVCATAEHAWRTTNAQRFDWGLITDSLAVHPVVETSSISFGIAF